MIILDLHVFLPYSQILYDRVYKYCIFHPIFMEPWLICQDINIFTKIVRSYTQISYNFVHKYCIHHPIFVEPWLIGHDTILFTKIVLVIWSLCTLTHPSGSNANIIRVLSWLVRQDPNLILFSILVWYCLSKHPFSSQNWTLLTCPNRIVKPFFLAYGEVQHIHAYFSPLLI